MTQFDSKLIRSRLNEIPDQDLKRMLQAQLLCCARPGEMCGLKYPSNSSQNTGDKLTVAVETYKPNLLNKIEVQTIQDVLLMETEQLWSRQDIAKIREEVLIITVHTEKRMGWKRECAIPLNKEYEPLSQEVYDYIKERQGSAEPVFPFKVEQLGPQKQKYSKMLAEAFKDLEQTIYPYKRARKEKGEYVRDEHEDLVKDNVPEHIKAFTPHTIRKARENELEYDYGFTPVEVARFGGWTLAMKMGTSVAQERYREGAWKPSFYKLCRKRC